MKKIVFVLIGIICGSSIYAGGIGINLFGFDICDVEFDVDPFRRGAQGASVYGNCYGSGYQTQRVVYVQPQYVQPQYVQQAIQPTVQQYQYRQVPSSMSSSDETKTIIIKDSQNVTINARDTFESSRRIIQPVQYQPLPQQYYQQPVQRVYYQQPTYYQQPVYYRY